MSVRRNCAIRSLFKCPENEPELMVVPGWIELRGTETVVPIAVDDSFDITFNLKSDEDLEELNTETVGWVPDLSPCNELIIEEVRGQNCSLDVTYIVHEKALIANVEVKLLSLNLPYPWSEYARRYLDGGPTPAGIFGRITASSTEKSEFTLSHLFCRNGNYFPTIYVGEAIPLSKPSFGVSFGSDINIAVDLYCSPDIHIARGIVHVVPKYHGTYAEVISGRYCDIQVEVTFSV